jgi:dimethylamine monooxygenase subunit A
MDLPEPPVYYPYLEGHSMQPGLSPITRSFGNGAADHFIFQPDTRTPDVLKNKMACRYRGIRRFYLQHHFTSRQYEAVCRFIMKTLCSNYPSLFRMAESGKHTIFSHPYHFASLAFTPTYQLLPHPIPFIDGLDGLCQLIPEDIALWAVDGNDRDYMSAIHLCAPNFWSPADKIGKPFFAVHGPVPDMGEFKRRYAPTLQQLIKRKKSWVRFAWGITTDCELNHHPVYGNEEKNEGIFIRYERQTLTGLPGSDTVLFTIKTHFTNFNKMDAPLREQVKTAVKQMTDSTLIYKRITGWK